MAWVLFITHPEVIIDPDIPVPDWRLSPLGRNRMSALARLPELADVTSVWSSTEQKARDGRDILAHHLTCPAKELRELGENDRSATGYLPAEEFWPVVDQFFADPDTSVRGWETSRAAQNRIVNAVGAVKSAAVKGDIAIVAHGGVATLLRCALKGLPISQDEAAPAMGSWFSFDRETHQPVTDWRRPPDVLAEEG